MTKPTIAVVGGTGAEGSGLALRWAAAGYPVIIGSRDGDRAADSAATLNQLLPDNAPAMRGLANLEATAAGDLIVLSVPYSAQTPTLEEIAPHCQNKTLITVVVPLKPPKVARVWQPPGGSAAQEAQDQLGEEVQVVAAFQNISATHLQDLSWEPNCDVLITGDDKAAKKHAIELAEAAGFVGIDAGLLLNTSVVEGLTAVLIGINIRHKVKGSGIQITGI